MFAVVEMLLCPSHSWISMEEIMVESLGYAENNAAEEEMEERHSRDKLRSCIDELDEREKELVMMRYYYEQKLAGFAPAYQGDGRFEIVIINESDKELKLQDKVKIMQWLTSEEVEGDSGKIRMSGLTIAPHSQGVVSIDISEGCFWAGLDVCL